ncbi:MAG: NAD(P)/FAD-dependent oxidoreductase [Jatrophihabitans sp.]
MTSAERTESDKYDVVVVGGGVAGLSGGTVLARAGRSVLVIDAGEPRNAPATAVHGFLSRDGIPPGELQDLGRGELAGYGGAVQAGRVATVTGSVGDFTVTIEDGTTVHARRLLITTGLVDDLPDVPGLRERWGRDVLHCPYCHGYEVRNQPIGVLSTGPMATHQALLFGQWSKDITVFLHTGPQPTDEEWEQLAARNVCVVDGEVVQVQVTDDALTGVQLRDGTVIPRHALVVGPRFVARSDVLTALGIGLVEHPMGIGSYVETGPGGSTDVPGVWAAGNVTDLMAQVVTSAAAGAGAAAAINADLLDEDVRDAVAKRRAPFSAASEAAACELVGVDRRHGL